MPNKCIIGNHEHTDILEQYTLVLCASFYKYPRFILLYVDVSQPGDRENVPQTIPDSSKTTTE